MLFYKLEAVHALRAWQVYSQPRFLLQCTVRNLRYEIEEGRNMRPSSLF